TTCISWIETLGTFAAAFAALERYHHEEDVIGSRCGRDFGRFSRLARLCWSAPFSRARRLSVLVGLCRRPGWRPGRPLLLAYRALLGRLCLARAPRAHLRLIRSRLFRCLDRRTRRCDVGDATRAVKQCPTCLLLQVIGSSFSRSSSTSFSTPCRRWAQLVRALGRCSSPPARSNRTICTLGSGHWPWIEPGDSLASL